ncbi:MAG: LysM peptidoglycan-binding domain-containing protein [Actinobacteria bacterium]|nr:LysM peptidoglycan-binding domain-containing protein [Actinomycetota bacterium]
MTRHLALPTRVIVIISTVAVALMLLLASQVQAAGDDANGEVTSVVVAEYMVRSGDTLWGIAAEYTDDDVRTMVGIISERNGLTSSIIHAGQVLEIPAES